MLQAHSLLWHYLWIAPHILELVLAYVFLRHGLHRQFPAFFTFILFDAIAELLLYSLDISPSVGGLTWWHIYLVFAVIEGLLRFGIIAELLRHLLQPWPALSQVGRFVVSAVGAILILFATVNAALKDPNATHILVNTAHYLQQWFFLVQAGLVVALLAFSRYFHVAWERMAFGIAFGCALAWCQFLATWTLLSTHLVTGTRVRLDMANMAVYHVAVLIWLYYGLVPERARDHATDSPYDPNLDAWNRELERILHQ